MNFPMSTFLYQLKTLSRFIQRNVLNIVYWITILLPLYLIVITIIDLSEYPVDIFSKNSVIFFFGAFDWCKSILAACIVLYPICVALNTYRMHSDDKIYNNIVKPYTETIIAKLFTRDFENPQMSEHFETRVKQIVADIADKEKRGVKSKRILRIYFDTYIKEHISKFECSGFSSTECIKKCKECTQPKPTYELNDPHSLEQFRSIAYELFYIAPSYKTFQEDIEKLYIGEIPSLNSPNK